MFKNKQHTVIITLIASSLAVGNSLSDNNGDVSKLYAQTRDDQDSGEDSELSLEKKYKIDDKPTTRYGTDTEESEYQSKCINNDKDFDFVRVDLACILDELDN